MKREDAAETSSYAGLPKMMTMREVSAYLHVHPNTIYRLVRRHQIPGFRIGYDWRFDIETIDTWRLRRGKLGG
jgi:excisionase family DNA binding protein